MASRSGRGENRDIIAEVTELGRSTKRFGQLLGERKAGQLTEG
jgi:hypothetical protein